MIERCLPYTMTGVPRLNALLNAVRYCVNRGIDGAFAECGVWRGGSILAMILALQELRSDPRQIYLFDTFEGMTEPDERDGRPQVERWEESSGRPWPEFFSPDNFNEESVRTLLLSTGYPAECLHFVRGPVEETIPEHGPGPLALLRLDTDWYASTRHELVHLYPRLQSGGVLVIDDYGHFEGCRRAVDEFFAENAPPVLLSAIDYSARIAIKH